MFSEVLSRLRYELKARAILFILFPINTRDIGFVRDETLKQDGGTVLSVIREKSEDRPWISRTLQNRSVSYLSLIVQIPFTEKLQTSDVGAKADSNFLRA